MAYPLSLKYNAIKLRKSGYSIKEIAKTLNIAVGTSSVWLRQIHVSPRGIQRMKNHQELSRYRMSLRWNRKREEEALLYHQLALTTLSKIQTNNSSQNKLNCALLFWAEGGKNNNHVRFINSDPLMITTFLKLFRSSFSLNETKLRVGLHLHEYHNSREMFQYWSNLTNIPLSQFHKLYLKPYTGKRKRKDYKGCATILYYDSVIAHELSALYNTFARSI